VSTNCLVDVYLINTIAFIYVRDKGVQIPNFLDPNLNDFTSLTLFWAFLVVVSIQFLLIFYLPPFPRK